MVLFVLVHHAYAVEPVPAVSSIAVESNFVELAISNIDPGGTYYIERNAALTTNNWQEVGSFEGAPESTNWIESVSGSATSAFYRVARDPYHAKVGEVAILFTRYHGVTGTVHIVNNRTVELRNFYYDGQGLDVVVYVSPNPSFSGGTSISGDIRGTNYVDATLRLTLPEGLDLDSISYVSIWCIDIPVSFGDGMFQ
jgi:hypothetical protein